MEIQICTIYAPSAVRFGESLMVVLGIGPGLLKSNNLLCWNGDDGHVVRTVFQVEEN